MILCIWKFPSPDYMGVSKNNGTPILIGFSIINHPFWGTPISPYWPVPLEGSGKRRVKFVEALDKGTWPTRNQWVCMVFISYSEVMIGRWFPENSMPDGCKCKNSSRFFPPASLSVVRVHRTLHRGVAHRPPHGLYGTWWQTRQEILLFQNWILRHDTSASIVCKLQPRKEHRRAKWNVVRWIWLGDFTRRQSRVWMDKVCLRYHSRAPFAWGCGEGIDCHLGRPNTIDRPLHRSRMEGLS